jgi:hypothetical protein
MNTQPARFSRAFVLPINTRGRAASFAWICRCKRSFGLTDSVWPSSWELSSADVAWNLSMQAMRHSRPTTAGGGRPWDGNGPKSGSSRPIRAARATGSCSRTHIGERPNAGIFTRRCSWACNWWRLRWGGQFGRNRRVQLREPRIPFACQLTAGRLRSRQRVSVRNSRTHKNLTVFELHSWNRASIRSTATNAGSHY